MGKAASVFLLIAGLINFFPVVGVLSASKLSQAYSIELLGNDLVILMRHRALLFGIVGGFIIYSVFVPAYQPVAMVMAAISMLGYLFFMWQEGGYNHSLYKVMVVDLIGIACLLAAFVLRRISES